MEIVGDRSLQDAHKNKFELLNDKVIKQLKNSRITTLFVKHRSFGWNTGYTFTHLFSKRLIHLVRVVRHMLTVYICVEYQ